MYLAVIAVMAWNAVAEVTEAVPNGASTWFPYAGVASGWGIVGMLVIMLFRGNVGTQREMDARDKQIAHQQETISTQAQTIAEFRTSIETSNALIQAVVDIARDRTTS